MTVDLLCQDKKRIMYGVEMQRKNYDNHQKRVRYVGANIDTYITEKGIEFPRISNAIRYYKEGKGREEMCKIMEEFAKEQQALGRESGREEMREEMQVKMRRYGKKQRHTGRRQGRTEGRRDGREEVVSVITLLRSGKDKEEIRHMGYDEATINDAIMVL